MKHFKHLLFLSIICSPIFFTNCGIEIDDNFILKKRNGYYILNATNELNPYGTTIIEINKGKLFWSVLTDSCRYDNSSSLTLDTITHHTSTEYTGIYQVSGINENTSELSAILKSNEIVKVFFQTGYFDPLYHNSKDFYLRLTITDNGDGIDFVIEPGKWDIDNSKNRCFYNINFIFNNGCIEVDRSYSYKFSKINSGSAIDNLIQFSECE
ncbi:MAG: hypothetical protein CMB82_00385 [Flammeovirgaceae bacterium]|nr:hypothetical protein [Flammeovirgaceae bacterium]|tara:strand:+ start:2689 stop:3321 length:633 start_codon:yes stop_codon:yes gene_type:complete